MNILAPTVGHGETLLAALCFCLVTIFIFDEEAAQEHNNDFGEQCGDPRYWSRWKTRRESTEVKEVADESL